MLKLAQRGEESQDQERIPGVLTSWIPLPINPRGSFSSSILCTPLFQALLYSPVILVGGEV